MSNESFELVSPQQLQLVDTRWDLNFICQKLGKETLQRPSDNKRYFYNFYSYSRIYLFKQFFFVLRF